MKKAVIILPTFNERENIRTLVPEIFAQIKHSPDWEVHILVVDDNSPDQTKQEVLLLKKKYKNLHLLSGKKEGLGRAYIRGFRFAIDKLNPEVLFEMDADWSHDPKLIPLFLKKVDDGADFVVGSRYIKGGSIPSDWGIHRKIFSFFGNIVIRIGFMRFDIHEWTNGYRAIRANFVSSVLLELNAFNGYVFQIAFLDRAVKKKLNIVEVPVQFKERKNGVSKISSFRYIFDILHYIFLNSPFVKFGIVGFIGFIVNAAGLEVFFRQGLTPAIAAAIGAEMAIISNFILNNFWSFSHKKIEQKHNYLPKFLQFNFVSTGSIIIQSVVVGLGTRFFGNQTRFVFLVIAIVLFIIPYSYIMYNKFIWRD